MKAIMKKSLVFVLSLALMLTVMLPCFSFVSMAETTDTTAGEGIISGVDAQTNSAENVVIDYDFSVEDDQMEAMVNFIPYNSNVAQSGALVEGNFGDHFEFTDSRLVHIPTEELNVTDMSGFFGHIASNVTTLIYANEQFRNFELVVQGIGSNDPYGDWKNFGIMFGVQDPTKWNAGGAGFAFWPTFNLENKSSVSITANTKYGSAKTIAADESTFSTFYGGKHAYTYTLRVEGNTATVTAAVYSQVLTATFTLPNDYLGGSVGLRFIPDTTNIMKIKITDLGGVVEEPVPVLDEEGVYDFSSAAAQALVKEDFDVYYSNTASTTKELAEANFDDHFQFMNGNIMVHKPTEIITQTNTAESLANTNVTTLIYNKKMLRDFEMTITAQGSGDLGEFADGTRDYQGDWKLFGGIFGNRVPTAWQSAGMGWETAGHFMLSGQSFVSVNSFPEKALAGGSLSTDNRLWPSFWGYKHMMTLRITVVGTTLTVDYIRDGNTDPTNTVTYDLGEAYKGGYVGFRFIPDATKVKKITIKDLGGIIEDSVKPTYDLNGIYDFATVEAKTMADVDFDIYNSVDITAEGGKSLTKVDFNEYVNVSASVLQVTPHVAESMTEYWDIWSKYRSTMIYNKDQYYNFELEYKFYTPESVGGTDWCDFYPIFGVEDPTKWNEAGYGYEVGIQFNIPNTNNAPFLRGQSSRDLAPQNIATSSVENITAYYGAKYGVTVKLTVENRKVTFTSQTFDTAAKVTFELPSTYRGGYVGLVLPKSKAQGYLYHFKLTDLGGAPTDEELKGDFDGDGVLGDADTAAMNDILLKKDGAEYVEILDMNDDGQIDVIDGILLRKEVAAAAKVE